MHNCPVRLGKSSGRYVLAVIPGDRQVDLRKVNQLFGGSRAHFATTEAAEYLAGSPSGTIIPFSFVSELTLVTDPTLLVHGSVFFNAARLNASIELNVEDYLRLSSPLIFSIVQ
jgi:Ala-tRNA(Pro) deacylase